MHIRLFELNFLRIFVLRDKCSSGTNDNKIDHCQIKSYFNTKSVHACTFSQIRLNQKMHAKYIFLSLHTKTQLTRTMLSYVYKQFKFYGE